MLQNSLVDLMSHIKYMSNRSELISKYRHDKKYYMTNYKEVPPDNDSVILYLLFVSIE